MDIFYRNSFLDSSISFSNASYDLVLNESFPAEDCVNGIGNFFPEGWQSVKKKIEFRIKIIFIADH